MKLSLQILTPEENILEKDVDHASFPTLSGMLDIYPNHSPLASALIPGVLTVYEGSTAKEQFFVGKGSVHVTPEKCTVLARTACPLEHLKEAEIKSKKETLTKEMSGDLSEAQQNLLQENIELEEAKLYVLSKKVIVPPLS